MRRWRRSWFQPPRWRVELAVAALVLVLLALVGAAAGARADVRVVGAVVVAVALARGAVQRRTDHSAWRGLRATSPVSDAELLAAERAVRDGTVPSPEPVLREAVRIADLRHDLEGGAVLIPVLNALLTAVSLGLAIQSGGLWWVVPPCLVAVTAVDWSRRRRFVHHRLRLRAAAEMSAPPATLIP